MSSNSKYSALISLLTPMFQKELNKNKTVDGQEEAGSDNEALGCQGLQSHYHLPLMQGSPATVTVAGPEVFTMHCKFYHRTAFIFSTAGFLLNKVGNNLEEVNENVYAENL